MNWKKYILLLLACISLTTTPILAQVSPRFYIPEPVFPIFDPEPEPDPFPPLPPPPPPPPPPAPVSPQVAGRTSDQFTVNELGAAVYSIPLAISPSSNGVAPDLAITYNSMQGNGLLGRGWNLSGLSVISRAPATKAQDNFLDPVDFDSHDRFLLDGERLQVVSGGAYGASGTSYRTEHESYTKVNFYGDKFKVWTKSGLIMEYGYTSNSRIEAQGRSNVLLWRVNRVYDNLGNYYTVTYSENNALGESYPTRIDYTGNFTHGKPTYASIRFEYENRTDKPIHYISGTKSSLTKRLSKIKAYYGSTLIRTYNLYYKTTGPDVASILSHIQECGQDGKCKEAIALTWQAQTNPNVNGKFNKVEFVGSIEGRRYWAGNTLKANGDFNGDGRADIVVVQTDGNNWVGLGNSNGTFNKVEHIGSVDGRRHSRDNTLFASGDFNGDGKSDIVALQTNGDQWVGISNGNGTFNRLESAGTIDGRLHWKSNSQLGVGDFNGDGRSDLIVVQSDGNNWVGLANSNGTFNRVEGIGSMDGRRYTNGQTFFTTGDFNGDGLSDLLMIQRDGNHCVGLSLGNGTFSRLEYTGTVEGRSHSNGNSMFTPGDFNGDGLTDFMVLQTDGNHYMGICLGNGTFTKVEYVPGLEYRRYNRDRAFLTSGDFNGDGLGDISVIQENGDHWMGYSKGNNQFIRSETLSGIEGRRYWANNTLFSAGDFTGDGITDVMVIQTDGNQWVGTSAAKRPFCLNKIVNARREIHIKHDFLTNTSVLTTNRAVYNATYPMIEYRAAMSVVSQVRMSNGIGGLTNIDYQYEGARLDLTGRGFLGFYKVIAIDHARGFKDISFFSHDHRYGGARMQKMEEYRLTDNYRVGWMYNTQQLRTSYGGKVFFGYVSSTVSRRYEGGLGTISEVTTNRTYDSYGNVTRKEIKHSYKYTTIEDRTYHNDANKWILGRVKTEKITRTRQGQPTQVRNKSFQYNSFYILMTREIIEPNNSAYKLTRDLQYDLYGNVTRISTTGHNGSANETRVQQYAYDTYGRFVTRETNEVGHVRTHSFDVAKGIPTRTTGPNGIQTNFTYDGFGRVLTQTVSGGANTTYKYIRIGSGNESYYVEKITQGQPKSREYYDILGRITRTLHIGFTGSWVYQVNKFDSKGRLYQVSDPYYSGGSVRWTTYTYDHNNRVTKETAPGNRIKTISYGRRAKTITNANGQVLTEYTDELGKLEYSRNTAGNYTRHYYDSFDNLIETRDASGNKTIMRYDLLGRKTYHSDGNTGVTTYKYNAFGDVIEEKNSRNQVTSLKYDKLGRIIERNEPEGRTTWQYDTGNKAKGRLYRVTAPNGYVETYYYDNYGRLNRTHYNGPGGAYNIYTSYDGYGRLLQTTYPTNFKTKQLYNSYGYLTEVRNAANNFAFWKGEAKNERNQWTRVRYGNNRVTNLYYDANQATLTRIYTGGVQDLRFTFDKVGNLKQRRDYSRNLTENFTYDAFNRLINTSIVGGTSSMMTYDALGNLTYRSDAGCYEYASSRPHAVTRIKDSNGNTLKTFAYDATGNMTRNHQTNLTYTSYNKPYRMTKGADKVEFDYGPNRNRQTQRIYKNNALQNTIRYVGSIYEKVTGVGGTRHLHYIMVEGAPVAIHRTGAGANTRYLHKDHLGSVQTITNESGGVVEVLSFNAWGQRRNPYSWLGQNGLTSLTTRGFTGHEMIDVMSLIHMNGRVYDPTIGRFLSADPHVSYQGTGQSLNRYSYVMNNPLSLVDPSGFFFKKLFKAIKNVFKAIASNPLAAIAGIVAGALTGGLVAGIVGSGFWGAVAVGAAAGFAGSFAATLVATGDFGLALKNGLIGGITGGLSGGLMHGIDQIFPHWMDTGVGTASKISGSARIANQMARSLTISAVNGVMNKIRGGDFADGFMLSFAGDMVRWARDAFVDWQAKLDYKVFQKEIDAYYNRINPDSDLSPLQQYRQTLKGTFNVANGEGLEDKAIIRLGRKLSVVDGRLRNVGIPDTENNNWWVRESGALSGLSRFVPGFNSMSVAHDFFADYMSQNHSWVPTLISSQASIPLFIGIEYAALMSDPMIYTLRGQ